MHVLSPFLRGNQVAVDPGLLLPTPTARYQVLSSSDAFESCLVVSPLKHCTGDSDLPSEPFIRETVIY